VSMVPGYKDLTLAPVRRDAAVATIGDGCGGSLESFGLAFMTSYFPSTTANVPDEEPSMNSTGGGSRLLKASVSFDGRYSSEVCCGENIGDGKRGEASIVFPCVATAPQRWEILKIEELGALGQYRVIKDRRKNLGGT
jgi:hypothetical protein